MKFVRTHDQIYMHENRYKKTKEMFKFIERKAFDKKKILNKEVVCDFGCAAGEFLYYLKKKQPNNTFFGTDIRNDLIRKAQKVLPDIKFLKKSVLKRNSFPKNFFHKSFLIGVHPIFDEFEKCFSNLIYWTKPSGKIFICEMFNPYPIDVLIKYRYSSKYNKGYYESGWNIFSEKSVSNFLKKNKYIKKFIFNEFIMPFDLKPQRDSVRSWTFQDSKRKRFITNGLSIIQTQQLLTIYLK